MALPPMLEDGGLGLGDAIGYDRLRFASVSSQRIALHYRECTPTPVLRRCGVQRTGYEDEVRRDRWKRRIPVYRVVPRLWASAVRRQGAV
jgi:hypothetical protein